MKTDNIVLLGDLNCNLLRVNECSSFSDLPTKTRNLLHIFDVFNMQNVIKEATRITPSTETVCTINVWGCAEILPRSQPSICNPQVKTKKTAAHSHYNQKLQTI